MFCPRLQSRIQAHLQFSFGTTNRLNSFGVDEDYLFLKIKNFNVNKVHVWDNFFAIALPMKLFLKSILEKNTKRLERQLFCMNPQKNKNLVKIYEPIRLFSTVSEILESLISFSLFTQNNFLHNVNLVLHQEITRIWFIICVR